MVGNRSRSQDQSKVEKYITARYAIGNVSMKDLSNKIKDFEQIVKVPYLKRTPKHEPTLSYFHLVVCLGECMMNVVSAMSGNIKRSRIVMSVSL